MNDNEDTMITIDLESDASLAAMTEWAGDLREQGFHAIVIHSDSPQVAPFTGAGFDDGDPAEHAIGAAYVYLEFFGGFVVDLAAPEAPAGLVVWRHGLRGLAGPADPLPICTARGGEA